MNNPLVSIIMPVRNGANYFAEALTFIKAQNVDMEIIVIDDASTDNTSEIAESFGCVVQRNETCLGLVSSKNIGLKIAKGKYVMFHDHDDLMMENALAALLNELEENAEISAVMAQMQDFFSPELSEAERAKILIRNEAYCGLFSGAILMRRKIFDVIGLFNESLKAGDIIDWSARMQEKNLLIKKLNFISAKRRIHSSNFGRTNKENEYKDYAAILRAKLQRK